MKRYLIIFEGRVQGVGFRYQCQTLAIQSNLTGYAQNLYNDNVQVEVQGDVNQLDNFLFTMLKGNHFIRVDNYSLKEIEIKLGEKNFRVF